MAVSADRMHEGRRGAGRSACTASEAIDFDEYVRRVGALCEACGDDRLASRVGREMRRLMAAAEWLPAECRQTGAETYRRHVLYADPLGRFTVLSVVWRPGQGTPVHGHTAWGAVGVYSGRPSVANYRLVRDGAVELACEAVCAPGDVTCVQRGIDYPHRVHNASDDVAITVHTYGRDLIADPASINIEL
ncbi:cysteine dioxygenase family protein [Lentisalinibacter sediminis]|uniref:cysteine dioxygenase family protein n=1 Tax=Lentisalinibacter sediminis TaxID=2992237 RepID=UPI00386EF720